MFSTLGAMLGVVDAGMPVPALGHAWDGERAPGYFQYRSGMGCVACCDAGSVGSQGGCRLTLAIPSVLGVPVRWVEAVRIVPPSWMVSNMQDDVH